MKAKATILFLGLGIIISGGSVLAENREILVYPNPARISQDPYITFKGVPPDAQIIIYTISGEEVQGFSGSDDSDEVKWDIIWIESGVYIYQVIMAENEIKEGKIEILSADQTPQIEEISPPEVGTFTEPAPSINRVYDLKQIRVCPNPVRGDEWYVTFQGVPLGAEIIIYNFRGEIIQTLRNESSDNNYSDKVIWDIIGIPGEVYSYQVKLGNEKKKGKILIYR